jgi:hypothetical protein
MDLFAMACRLLRQLRHKPADRPIGPDAADMGTAFGLEVSLLDSEQLDEADSHWRRPHPAARR